MTTSNLQFVPAEDGSFTFDTGVLKGVLRKEGRSIGLVPVTYIPDATVLSRGEGLFNHYRVFTIGKRYGKGARDLPSKAERHEDGSVEAIWEVTSECPFELRGKYTWAAPNTIDVVTTVHAQATLEAFEVFLGSYYQPPFIDSQVWAKHDPSGGDKPCFVAADEALGVWQAFPRDEQAVAIIKDGRWTLEPSPLDWVIMPEYALPLAIRRDPNTGLTIITMTKRDECFGVFTPYGEERHYSNYLSLFGNDIAPGESASTCSRIVVLPNPTEAEILDAANTFLNA